MSEWVVGGTTRWGRRELQPAHRRRHVAPAEELPSEDGEGSGDGLRLGRGEALGGVALAGGAGRLVVVVAAVGATVGGGVGQEGGEALAGRVVVVAVGAVAAEAAAGVDGAHGLDERGDVVGDRSSSRRDGDQAGGPKGQGRC